MSCGRRQERLDETADGIKQRLGKDVAEAMIYLAGPSGNFITVEVLTVDGGMSQMGWMWPAGRPEYFEDIIG